MTFIAGLICGCILGKNIYGKFSFGLALIYWIAAFVAGMLLLAMAEIISLLQLLATQKYELLCKTEDAEEKNPNKNVYVNLNKLEDEPKKTVEEKTEPKFGVAEEIENAMIKCSNCGRIQKIGRDSCSRCGAIFTEK